MRIRLVKFHNIILLYIAVNTFLFYVETFCSFMISFDFKRIHLITKMSDYTCNTLKKLFNIEHYKCNDNCLAIDYFGRFGNQLHQFHHALQVAQATSIKKVLIFPGFLYQNHSFMYDDILFQINSGKDECFHHFFFFNSRKLNRLKEIDFNSKSWKKFQAKFLDKYRAIVPENALIVHIRSGDVFSENCEHHKYGQPPCKYYLDAISMRNWSKVIVVAEDRKNPCVDIVINVTGNYEKRSFDEDMAIMLNSRNLVTSSGTFGYSIILLSQKIQNVFCFNLPKNIKKNCLKCPYINTMNCVPHKNYKNIVLKNWTNSKIQRQMMIKSSCETWTNYSHL